MRKLALGKGLRALLNGTSVPGHSKKSSSDRENLTEGKLSPGVKSLLRPEPRLSNETESDAEQPNEQNPFWRNWRLMQWLLLAADLVLLTLASVLVFKTSGRMNFAESALCCISLGLGAVLALLALLGNRER